MRQELEDKTFNDFPELFHDKEDRTKSLMCFGFSCNDGWFQLIYDLCKKLHDMDLPEGFSVLQVKEKFGTLRFYTNGYSDDIRNAITEAELLSAKTCEDCGITADEDPTVSTRGGSWVKTRCEKCDLHGQGSD